VHGRALWEPWPGRVQALLAVTPRSPVVQEQPPLPDEEFELWERLRPQGGPPQEQQQVRPRQTRRRAPPRWGATKAI
jgi:hypothetical protein